MAKAKKMKEEKKTFSIGKILSVIAIILVVLFVVEIKINEESVKENNIKENNIKENNIKENNIKENNVKENNVKENYIKENNVKEIKEEKTFENLIIKNIDIKYENKNSFFKLELANESDTDFQGRNIKIIFENEGGTEYAIIKYNLTSIKSKESFYINTSTNIDLTQASDFHIENE